MTSVEYQQLVEFLGGRFTEIGRQFGEVNGRLDGVDARLGEVHARLDGVHARLGEVYRRFTEMDRWFDEVDLRLTELRQEMLGHFDAIYHRFERLEQEYYAITQALRRIEAGLADERGRREILERALADLKEHVAELQSRIEDIEQRLGR
jgi:chromosome segregation ATPase